MLTPPGKPQGIGRLRRGTPVLALPGNPVSAFVSFEAFVRPVLLRLRGLTDVLPQDVTAVVAQGWRKQPGRAQFMPVVLTTGPEPGAEVRVRRAVPGGSGSHLVAGLAQVQGLAVIDVDVELVRPGDKVRVMRVGR